MSQKSNPEGLFWQLLEKAEREILEEAIARYGRGAPEALGISPNAFFKRKRRFGLKLKRGRPRGEKKSTPLKGSSPSSWGAPPANGRLESSGNGSPPPAEPPVATLSWLINAARRK